MSIDAYVLYSVIGFLIGWISNRSAFFGNDRVNYLMAGIVTAYASISQLVPSFPMPSMPVLLVSLGYFLGTFVEKFVGRIV